MIINEIQVKGYLKSKGIAPGHSKILMALLSGYKIISELLGTPNNFKQPDIKHLVGKGVIEKQNNIYTLSPIKEAIFEYCPVCGTSHDKFKPVVGSPSLKYCPGCRIVRES